MSFLSKSKQRWTGLHQQSRPWVGKWRMLETLPGDVLLRERCSPFCSTTPRHGLMPVTRGCIISYHIIMSWQEHHWIFCFPSSGVWSWTVNSCCVHQSRVIEAWVVGHKKSTYLTLLGHFHVVIVSQICNLIEDSILFWSLRFWLPLAFVGLLLPSLWSIEKKHSQFVSFIFLHFYFQ